MERRSCWELLGAGDSVESMDSLAGRDRRSVESDGDPVAVLPGTWLGETVRPERPGVVVWLSGRSTEFVVGNLSDLGQGGAWKREAWKRKAALAETCSGRAYVP